MNKEKRIGRILLCLIVSFVMVFTLIPRMPSGLAFAAAGQVPEHAKILQQNNDGTYTIALNITGESEKKPQHVNVIVIVDRSGSMGEPTGPDQATYTASNDNGNPRYGIVNGEYVRLTRYQQFGRYYYYYGNTQYTGTRYIRTVLESRLDATQDAVNGLAEALLGYNTQAGNDSDTVEMALVSFSTNSTTDVAKTTSYATFSGEVDDLEADGGTNWESALSRANGISFGDEDPTYVIFFSDGAPTFHTSNGGYNNYNSDYGVYGSGQEEEPNMERSYTQAADDARTLANKIGTNNFYTIFAYGEDFGATYMTDLTTAAGAPAGNNYTAANTVALQQAFAEILEAIEMTGIGNVDLEDGTTSNVTTASGAAHLLDVADPDTFKYYRAGGTNEDGTEKYDSDANTITDPDGIVTNIGEEWADAPAATFEDGAVKWDLGDDFLLENGVTYTVTFDCWPSQETLDHIASIKNDSTYYDTLDPAIQQYLDRNGNLKTNTSATLSYEDTRTEHKEKEDEPIGYENPDPVPTNAVEQLAVSKAWNNQLEDEWDKPEEIVLDVTRDGDNTYTATLNDDNDWEDSVYISIGIMKTSGEGDDEQIQLLTTGHNFTFAEPGAASGYKWELNVPTVRPMKINGTDTILVLVDEDHPVPDGATTYTLPDQDGVAGGTYYVDNEMVSLTATNERRSSVNLTKEVIGEDVPEDAVFPFTVNIVDSLAPATAPSEEEDPDHESDYWVWISVRDKDGNRITEGVEGATHSGGGWWYAPSGTDVTIPVKAGYSIRFNNLPVDSTYTITEGTLPNGFVFDDAKIEIIEGIGTKTDSFEVDKDSKTASGTVQETNTLYKVTMTNKYELIDINVDKVWDDASDQDGKRPETLTLTLNGLPSGTTAPTPVIEKSEDGNTWTYTWKAVPRYDADGNELTYTVTEGTVPTGYECSGSPASDDGTITNTHTPEVTSVTVTKAWADGSNQDGNRPDALTLTLNNVPEGTTTPTPTITKDGDNWTYTWEGLPKYADGEEIEYTVSEETVPEGYQVSGSPANAGGTITNSYTPEETSVTVTKAWVDGSNQDGIRPDTLELTLNGLPEGTTAPTPTITKDGDNWTYTWSGLPKNEAGEAITYTVTEGTVPTGYQVSGSPANAGGTITNSHTPEETSVTVTKAWSDASNQDGIRPETLELTLNGLPEGVEAPDPEITKDGDNWTYTWSGLPKNEAGEAIEYTVTEGTVPTGYQVSGSPANAGGTITNTHTPEETSVTVTKAWDDASDQDGIRPETLELTLNGLPEGVEAPTPTIEESEDGNSWTYTWPGLPKNEAGEAITYTVTEGTVPEGYNCETTTVNAGGTITNSHTPEQTEVSVAKVWDDANDQDGIRPASLVVALMNGEEKVDEVTLNEGNNWTATITGLPKNAAGEPITYTWEEDEDSLPEGYELSDTTTKTDEDGVVTTTLTNSYTPEETEATVKKVWDDGDNQDGKRPESITVQLKGDDEAVGDPITLSDENNWTETVTGLPKNAAGEPITYTWEEDEDALPEGYTLTGAAVDEDDPTIITLTNHREIEKVNVTVEKVWDDNDDQDGKRPDDVSVQLKADGEAIGDPVTLNEDNEWSYTWENLDKNKAGAVGQEVEYTVEEVKVPTGYEADVTGNATTASGDESSNETIGYIITNVHEPETINLTIIKEWDDNEDQDGKRPDDLTVNLSDGETTVTLSENNKWTATVKGLPRYAAGEEIEYSWTEDGLSDDYELTDTATTDETDEETGKLTIITTLTNTHELEKTDVSVEKTWDDADDRDGIRPDSVTVTLLANGEEVTQADIIATVELNEDNGWKYTWEGLYVYAEGEEIAYTVEEKAIDDYEPEITGSAANGFTIKNIHQAKPEAVWSDPPVKKEVKGNPSKDETFTFQMKAVTEGAPMPDGSEDGVKTVTITGPGEEEFGKMYFTEAGTYVYEITEVDTKAANYTYDTTKYTLTVEVTEEKVGNQVKLNKTETVKGGNGTIVFTNTYEEPPIPTGDTTIVVPYIVIGVSALILLLMLLFRTRKNRA